MTTIRPALAQDFEAVYPLLEEFRNIRLTKDDWRQLFVPRWHSDETEFGYLMEEENRVVGFLGTLHSTRSIHGEPQKFINLCAWRVHEDFRSESLSLLLPVLRRRDATITNFTASVRVAKIIRGLGFKDLDQRVKIILPLPSLPNPALAVQVESDPQKIADYLEGLPRQVLEDHAGLKCRHLLIKTKIGNCYMICNQILKKRMPVLQVHYLSNPDLFSKAIYNAMPQIGLKYRVVGMAVGEHFLRGRPVRGALTIEQRLAFLYRSTRVKPEEIDTAYSEIQLLGL